MTNNYIPPKFKLMEFFGSNGKLSESVKTRYEEFKEYVLEKTGVKEKYIEELEDMAGPDNPLGYYASYQRLCTTLKYHQRKQDKRPPHGKGGNKYGKI